MINITEEVATCDRCKSRQPLVLAVATGWGLDPESGEALCPSCLKVESTRWSALLEAYQYDAQVDG